MSDKNKKNKSIFGMLLVLAWLLFILLAVIFYFFFSSENGKVGTTDSTDEDQTRFVYETNANIDINALIIDYYYAIVNCDQTALSAMVTDPSQFNDMKPYEQQAEVITKYSNVNCYSMPGYSDDAVLVYVTSNISITGVSCTPMDIKRFYIVTAEDGSYKIYNQEFDANVKAYIDDIQAKSDIQELYKTVNENISYNRENDKTFSDFYDKVSEGVK